MENMRSNDLILRKFYITDTNLLTIYPDGNHRVRLNMLKLACDYDVLTTAKKDNKKDILINFNIICNEEEKPGYIFNVGVVGEFTLNNIDSINESAEQQYILYTALPMVINSARIFILNITSMYFFGPFIIPALDLHKLINRKQLESE